MYPPDDRAGLADVKTAVADVLNGLETALLCLKNECRRLLPALEAEVARRRLDLFKAELNEERRHAHHEK